MSYITFWSGLDTIGNNIVSVETSSSRVIMDFGMLNLNNKESVNLMSRYELVKAGALPRIPYLYNDSAIDSIIPVCGEPFENQAIFISHLHLDHMAGLKYLPSEIDVYMSNTSYKWYKKFIEIGEDVDSEANVIGVEYNTPIRIGDITCMFYENDHDVEGTSSIMIEVDNKRIVHSGDMRKTGFYPERVHQLMEDLNDIDLLLLEGTSFSHNIEKASGCRSEVHLLNELQKLLASNETVVINPYIRNVKRLEEIDSLSRRMNRPIILEDEYRKLIGKMNPSKETNFNQISYKNIHKLADFEAGIYVHMNGEPLGEFDSRYANMLNTVKEKGFKFIDLSVSGHASREDILSIARDIHPRKIVPWHTLQPNVMKEALENNGHKVFMPEQSIKYKLDNILNS